MLDIIDDQVLNTIVRIFVLVLTVYYIVQVVDFLVNIKFKNREVMSKVIKKVRGYSVEDVSQKAYELGITPDNFIKHDAFYINSHDFIHEILYWGNKEESK